MGIELLYLTYLTLFTACMWIPYIMNMISVRGFINAVGYPENPKPLAPWAARMKDAHYNMVENLVVFAPLVLIASSQGISNTATILACKLFVWMRIIHFISLTLKVPWLRTIAFLISFSCLIVIALQIIR